MLQTRTLAALAFVVVAGAAAWWQLSRPDEHIETAPPRGPLPEFSAADIDAIDIRSPEEGKTVSLAKDGDGWKVTAPVEDRADAAAVDRAIEQLAGARIADRPSATSKESWDKLQVGDGDVLTVTLSSSGTPIATLHIGKTGRFVRIGDAPEVYALRGVSRAMLERGVAQWRDRTVLKFDRDKVATVTAVDATGKAVARRSAPSAAAGGDAGPPPSSDSETWTLEEGAPIVGTFDPAVPKTIVSRLYHLIATDFADGVSKAAAGLDHPALTLTVTLDDGTAHTLLVGGKADDTHVYIGRPDSDRVWTLLSSSADSFAKGPVQWRDRTIAKLPAADVAAMDVRHGDFRIVARRSGDGWTVAQPKGVQIDKGKLDSLAGAMASLVGAKIATDVPPRAFARPVAVARFTDEQGHTIEISLAAKREGDNLWPVKASTRRDVVLLADYQARRFLVERDTYVASK